MPNAEPACCAPHMREGYEQNTSDLIEACGRKDICTIRILLSFRGYDLDKWELLLVKSLAADDVDMFDLLLVRQLREHMLLRVAVSGNVRIMKLVLNKHKYHAYELERSLMRSICDGNLAMVCVITEQIKWGYSFIEAFRKAACEGQVEIMKLLREKDRCTKLALDFTLALVCEIGHLDCAKELIIMGANVAYNRNEALRNATRNGHCHIVRLLRVIIDDDGERSEK